MNKIYAFVTFKVPKMAGIQDMKDICDGFREKDNKFISDVYRY